MSKAKKTNNQYPEEFMQEAVRLALESRQPKTQATKGLGITDGLLYSWIKKI